MKMFEIKGKINTAICYATVAEDEAIEQIRRMCDYPMTEGAKIRIMPDVHAGKGCTIGLHPQPIQPVERNLLIFGQICSGFPLTP